MKQLRVFLALLVVGGVLGFSFWQVLSRGRSEAVPGQITLRIGHWLLQSGIRESFDEAAQAYQKLHPNVRVEQVAVPIRMWPSWLRTQLVGGSAPDLMGMRNVNEEIISRHFIPITDRLDEVNSYNDGTPLQGLPWRETFVDGLDSMRTMTPTTGEVSSVMLLLNTTRLFYNRTLLQAITGSSEPPADYAALIALGEQVAAHNKRAGTRLVPIAACGPYAEYMFAGLLSSQTQTLVGDLSPMRTLNLQSAEVAGLMAGGRLSYEAPELRASLQLLGDVSRLMTPGFGQLQREDALFAFLQGNAVMIFAGSWDYTVFAKDAEFEVGICALPLPNRDDPRFGKFVIGPSAEPVGAPDASFGIVRTSANPEVALDFLKFLTSYRTARMLSENTYRMSAIIGIAPPAHAADLAPVTEGEIGGFRPDFSASFGGGNAHHVFQRNLHLLLGERGDLDAFVRRLEEEMPSALNADLGRHASRALGRVRQLDARLGLILTHPEPSSGRWPRVAEIQHELQAEYRRTRAAVGR